MFGALPVDLYTVPQHEELKRSSQHVCSVAVYANMALDAAVRAGRVSRLYGGTDTRLLSPGGACETLLPT